MNGRILFLYIVTIFVTSCSNSITSDIVQDDFFAESSVSTRSSSQEEASSATDSLNHNQSSSQKGTSLIGGLDEVFPFGDSAYPYAGIPRLLIETENHQGVLDRENYLSAQMRFYGECLADGLGISLQIRGRGNSSWTEMPKHSFRLKLNKKQSLLGMPPDRDWALIANYADKTLMKNYLSYRLAADAGMEYSPKSEFLELYMNGEYLGVYLLTEIIEVEKQRVNIPETGDSYLVEFDAKYNEDEQVIFSNVLAENKPFRVHSPKDASATSLNNLLSHIEKFEKFLQNVENVTLEEIEEWIDVDAYAKHFWIQEFSKNPDANFLTSVYFTWMENDVIKMGPVWDFDVAFGGMRIYNEALALSENWQTRDAYWNARLFSNKAFADTVDRYWKKLSPIFEGAEGIIDSLGEALELPAQNNFKRWDILHEHGKWISNSVRNYGEAVNNLRKWVVGRRRWINENTP